MSKTFRWISEFIVTKMPSRRRHRRRQGPTRARGGRAPVRAEAPQRSRRERASNIVGAITAVTLWCSDSFQFHTDLLEKLEIVELRPLLGELALIVVAKDVVDDVAHGLPRRLDTSDWAVDQLVLKDA
jgi:hypothetical protein